MATITQLLSNSKNSYFKILRIKMAKTLKISLKIVRKDLI